MYLFPRGANITSAPEAAEQDIKTLLSNLHLINDNGKLKNAALLLFGKDPKKYFTSAYFKIGRFGESDADLKFQDVVEGNLIEMADKVMEILKNKYLVFQIHYEGMQRVEELEYPEPALREAIFKLLFTKTIKAQPFNSAFMTTGYRFGIPVPCRTN